MHDKPVTFDAIRQAMKKYSYPFYSRGNFNLNIIGIRASNREAGHFDDEIVVLFYHYGAPVMLSFPATTDSGRPGLLRPLLRRGAAVMASGHYPGMWRIGEHRGRPALVQRGACSVYRDNNRDTRIDIGAETETGLYGINCHDGGYAQKVGHWSKGCQVVQRRSDHQVLMAMARCGAERWGNSFSYTLLDEEKLWTQ